MGAAEHVVAARSRARWGATGVPAVARALLAAPAGTIEVEHMLRPLVVVMAGANQFDPHKD